MNSALPGGTNPPKHPVTPDSELVYSDPRTILKREFLRQGWTGFGVLFLAYVFAFSPAVVDDEASSLAWLFGAFLFPAVTVPAAVVAGLPLRLIPRMRRWWIANCELAYVGILLGCWFLVLAYLVGHYGVAVEGAAYTPFEPDNTLLVSGWLLLAFFTTHAWMPSRWRRGNRKLTI